MTVVTRARAQVRDHDQQVDDACVPGHLRVATAQSWVSQSHTGDRRRETPCEIPWRGAPKLFFRGSKPGADCAMSSHEWRDASRSSRCVSYVSVTHLSPHGGDQTSPDESRPTPLPAFEHLREDKTSIETSTRDLGCIPFLGEREKERGRSLDNQIETKKMLCEARKIHVDFGEVETGATTVKWLEIVNESCVSVRLLVFNIIYSFQLCRLT